MPASPTAAPEPPEPARSARQKVSVGRELLEHAALVIAIRLAATLGYARAVRSGAALGALYGEAVRRLRTRDHEVAARNLALAFPALAEARRAAILRAMWRHWGRALVEMGSIGRLGRDRLRDLVTLDPPDGPREIFARARETGALVLTAHFGSFELLHAACAAHGFPITIVHRTLANRHVDRWLSEARERHGTRLLRRGSAARPILRALRCGEVVAVPFDQRPRDPSRVFAPFFSVPAATNSGLARLALAANAPVFPVFLVREGETVRHRAVVLPAIPLVRSGDRERDVVANSERFNLALEGMIRQHPEQWIWMYHRWKEHLKGRIPSERGSPSRAGAAVRSGGARPRDVAAAPGLSADRTP